LSDDPAVQKESFSSFSLPSNPGNDFSRGGGGQYRPAPKRDSYDISRALAMPHNMDNNNNNLSYGASIAASLSRAARARLSFMSRKSTGSRKSLKFYADLAFDIPPPVPDKPKPVTLASYQGDVSLIGKEAVDMRMTKMSMLRETCSVERPGTGSADSSGAETDWTHSSETAWEDDAVSSCASSVAGLLKEGRFEWQTTEPLVIHHTAKDLQPMEDVQLFRPDSPTDPTTSRQSTGKNKKDKEGAHDSNVQPPASVLEPESFPPPLSSVSNVSVRSRFSDASLFSMASPLSETRSNKSLPERPSAPEPTHSPTALSEGAEIPHRLESKESHSNEEAASDQKSITSPSSSSAHDSAADAPARPRPRLSLVSRSVSSSSFKSRASSKAYTLPTPIRVNFDIGGDLDLALTSYGLEQRRSLGHQTTSSMSSTSTTRGEAGGGLSTRTSIAASSVTWDEPETPRAAIRPLTPESPRTPVSTSSPISISGPTITLSKTHQHARTLSVRITEELTRLEREAEADRQRGMLKKLVLANTRLGASRRPCSSSSESDNDSDEERQSVVLPTERAVKGGVGVFLQPPPLAALEVRSQRGSEGYLSSHGGSEPMTPETPKYAKSPFGSSGSGNSPATTAGMTTTTTDYSYSDGDELGFDVTELGLDIGDHGGESGDGDDEGEDENKSKHKRGEQGTITKGLETFIRPQFDFNTPLSYSFSRQSVEYDDEAEAGTRESGCETFLVSLFPYNGWLILAFLCVCSALGRWSGWKKNGPRHIPQRGSSREPGAATVVVIPVQGK
jgi:hypothetical protein